MERFLNNIQLDRLSFWLGFLAASLFWWLLARLRPIIKRAAEDLRERLRQSREAAKIGIEYKFINETLQYVQKLHIAAPLFSLEEILITPRLLVPPPPVEPGAPPPLADITEEAIPYLPDWPDMAAVYQSPTLPLAEALQSESNLVLIGEPGSGKTVALASLASQVIQRDGELGNLLERVPIFVHACDWLAASPLSTDETQPGKDEVLAKVKFALSGYLPNAVQNALDDFLQKVFSHGRALLLLDGLDEIPPEMVDRVSADIHRLLKQFPQTRIVLSASSRYLGRLTRLGFIPLAMAAWNQDRQNAYARLWGDLWKQYVATPAEDGSIEVEPVLINSWTLGQQEFLTPFELTLKLWGAYAGDSLGIRASDGIEAQLRRLLDGVAGARQALEQMARQATALSKPFFTQTEVEQWISNPAQLPVPDLPQVAPFTLEEDNEKEGDLAVEELPEIGTATTVKASQVIAAALENGLLVSRGKDGFGFVHILYSGYLAGCALAKDKEEQPSLAVLQWENEVLANRYLASRRKDSTWLDTVPENASHPFMPELLTAATWLKDAPDQGDWSSKLMRRLAGVLQNPDFDTGVLARLISALVRSSNSGVSVLFRQLLASENPAVRQLSALALGMQKDPKAVDSLTHLLTDSSPSVRRAASLALVAVGNKPALETIAATLLTGDEAQRRFAAEALANHMEEGHPTLLEGASLEDLMVRRAVIYGLQRIKLPWAIQTLEKLQMEDSQWVVKTGATQALEEIAQPVQHIPKPLPSLTETPWLIAFAGEKGMGVAPGKPAMDLVLMAQEEGSEEHRLAALYYLSRYGDESAMLPVLETYKNSSGEIRAAASNTLWHLCAAGYEIQVPLYSGFK